MTYKEPTHTIVFDKEARDNIEHTLRDVIRQAQNGVTAFSLTGILGNILFDLDLTEINP